MPKAKEPASKPKSKQQLHPAMEAVKWKPGQSGNPAGRQKKTPLTALYEEILSNPEHMEIVRKAVIKSLGRGQMAMVLQLREMAERVEGKVVQTVEADINLNVGLAERMKRASERTGD